jgi:hypothetical protein
MRKILPFVALLLPLAMFSCGTTETRTIRSTEIELLEEYPMEGANTVTGVWVLDLGDIDASRIKSARLVNISFTTASPANTNDMEEMTVQLAAPGAAMQKVAVINPIPQGTSTFTANVAGDQANLAPLLNQREVTLVSDINLKRDLEGELLLKAVMEFEVQVKQ